MVAEIVIASACLYGNSEACNTGLHTYAKYRGLDVKAEEIGNKLKKHHPYVHALGTVGVALGQKKYNMILYKNIGAQVDFSKEEDPKTIIFYRFTF